MWLRRTSNSILLLLFPKKKGSRLYKGKVHRCYFLPTIPGTDKMHDNSAILYNPVKNVPSCDFLYSLLFVNSRPIFSYVGSFFVFYSEFLILRLRPLSSRHLICESADGDDIKDYIVISACTFYFVLLYACTFFELFTSYDQL
jgi:hypothetical protein